MFLGTYGWKLGVKGIPYDLGAMIRSWSKHGPHKNQSTGLARFYRGLGGIDANWAEAHYSPQEMSQDSEKPWLINWKRSIAGAGSQ